MPKLSNMEELASSMGHNVQTALENYVKIDWFFEFFENRLSWENRNKNKYDNILSQKQYKDKSSTILYGKTYRYRVDL